MQTTRDFLSVNHPVDICFAHIVKSSNNRTDMKTKLDGSSCSVANITLWCSLSFTVEQWWDVWFVRGLIIHKQKLQPTNRMADILGCF